jgi:hypothetical protein
MSSAGAGLEGEVQVQLPWESCATERNPFCISNAERFCDILVYGVPTFSKNSEAVGCAADGILCLARLDFLGGMVGWWDEMSDARHVMWLFGWLAWSRAWTHFIFLELSGGLGGGKRQNILSFRRWTRPHVRLEVGASQSGARMPIGFGVFEVLEPTTTTSG